MGAQASASRTRIELSRRGGWRAASGSAAPVTGRRRRRRGRPPAKAAPLPVRYANPKEPRAEVVRARQAAGMVSRCREGRLESQSMLIKQIGKQ
jgi:hypothetical protein